MKLYHNTTRSKIIVATWSICCLFPRHSNFIDFNSNSSSLTSLIWASSFLFLPISSETKKQQINIGNTCWVIFIH
ncbi:hypothetical protein MtrunA17_Chr4g0019011 [Medicago truncatula]|uniref:Uncharacterized protein n=1 Tax=Medicago truncatula TaxID=3880 RepID=A0A396I521_MEDTR|nr:hypothetical protein MtrunA17_Chr4g0019011 [Medicago truncatula]